MFDQKPIDLYEVVRHAMVTRGITARQLSSMLGLHLNSMTSLLSQARHGKSPNGMCIDHFRRVMNAMDYEVDVTVHDRRER